MPTVRCALVQPRELSLKSNPRDICALNEFPPRIAQHLRKLVHERHLATIGVSPPECRFTSACPQNDHMRPGPFRRLDEILAAQKRLHASTVLRNDTKFMRSQSGLAIPAESVPRVTPLGLHAQPTLAPPRP